MPVQAPAAVPRATAAAARRTPALELLARGVRVFRAVGVVGVVGVCWGEARLQGGSRRAVCRDVVDFEILESRQYAAIQSGDEGGAAGVGDLGFPKV